jgi:hypothetical protein
MCFLAGFNSDPFDFFEATGKIFDTVLRGVSTETFKIVQQVAISLVVISLLIDTIRFGLKKEYTAVERKGWYWPDLIFKSLLIVIINNFPYLFGLLYEVMYKATKL